MRKAETGRSREDRAAGGSVARAAALALFLAAYGVYLVGHVATGVGGSDSSGYANAARALASGRLVARARSLDALALRDRDLRLVLPLGFVPGPRPGTVAPLYPVGFPAHEALFAAVAGWRRGPYLVGPFAALGCLALVYVIARLLSLSRTSAVACAGVLAAWPSFVFQSLQPMSDVVGLFWCLAAIAAALAARRRSAWAAAGGAAFGIAVLVRPTNALLAVPLAFALPWTVPALALFAAGGAPFAGLLALYQRISYGSAWRSGWERSGHLQAFALSHFAARLTYYVGWLARTLTPLPLLGWLAVVASRRTPIRDRLLLFSWLGAFLAAFSFYGPYESFLFLRFLLPGFPAIPLAACLVVERLLDRPRGAVARAAAVLLLGAVLAAEVATFRRLRLAAVVRDEGSAYRETSVWADGELPVDGVLLAGNASGALTYYTERPLVRVDVLEPGDAAVVRAAADRADLRLFALLFPEEEDELCRRFPGGWRKIGERRRIGLWELAESRGRD